jgi:hypothetical protein
MHSHGRTTVLCILVMTLSLTTRMQAADAASRAASARASNARAAALAQSRHMDGGGSTSNSFFIGVVPGNLVTDPISISTFFAHPTTVNYGDGTEITYQAGETPSHIYTAGGSYLIKAVTGDGDDLITVNLAVVVPFDSSAAQVYGMGVYGDYNDPTQTVVQYDFDGAPTGTLDFGDGSPTVSVDTSALQQAHTYAKGFWNAVLQVNDGSQTRSGSVSFTTPLITGKIPQIGVSNVVITPNPAKANEPVSFSGSVTVKNVSGDVSGYLDFGDGSPSFSISGADGLKTTIQHTYAADGVYNAALTLYASGASSTTKAFVVVGNSTVVNSVNGVFATERDLGGGNIELALNISNLAGATDANTEFVDTLANTAAGLQARLAPVPGLVPSRAFVVPTMAVATSTLIDGTGVVKGKARKTIVVGAREAGDSAGLAAPASTEIVLSKMSGKFLFTKTTPDQISFSGTIQLPPGFDPNKTGGNPVVIGIGNIVDTLNVDAKGKPIDKSTGASQRIKKLSVKFPKLAGPAVGGETAKIDVTLGLADMDTAGLDTEGITASLRSDEKKLKTAPRFIQVNMLLAGVPYESYVPVQYKVSTKGDAGQIQGRAGK